MPATSPALAFSVSRSPYCWSHFAAVFGPTPGDARDVVDRIAYERQIVGDLLGRHAELLLDAGAIELRVVHRVDERDVAVDELSEILVTGRDDRRGAGGRRLSRERADDVVGLDALDAQQRDSHGLDGLEQRRDLCAQLVGHRRPVGLVLGVQVRAERLAGRVEDDGHVRRLLLVEQLVEHVDDAEHGVGRLTGLGRQHRDRVEGAIQVRRAVDKDERASAHARARRRSSPARSAGGSTRSMGRASPGRESGPCWPQPRCAGRDQHGENYGTRARAS